MNRLLQLVVWRRDLSMTTRPGPAFASRVVAIVFVVVAVQ